MADRFPGPQAVGKPEDLGLHRELAQSRGLRIVEVGKRETWQDQPETHSLTSLCRFAPRNDSPLSLSLRAKRSNLHPACQETGCGRGIDYNPDGMQPGR